MKAESRKPVGHARVMEIMEASKRGLEMYLTVQEVAAVTRLSVATLVSYRQNGGGPQFIRINRNIFYHLTDVINYMNAQTFIRIE